MSWSWTGRASSRSSARRGGGAPLLAGPKLDAALRRVRRSVNADAGVVDARGRILGTTDPGARQSFAEATRAASSGTPNSGESSFDGRIEARAAFPVTLGGARYGVLLHRPLDETAEAAAIVRRKFVIAAAISLVVALLLGIMLSSGLARRLRSLRDTALRVAEIGPIAEVQADGAS